MTWTQECIWHGVHTRLEWHGMVNWRVSGIACAGQGTEMSLRLAWHGRGKDMPWTMAWPQHGNWHDMVVTPPCHDIGFGCRMRL